MKIVKLIILSIVLNISITNKMFAQWETQESGVNVDLLDVCFVDSLYGWVVGDSSTILATNDGGENWFKKSHLQNGDFTGIQFVDRDVGFIIGKKGLILSTTDGGNTWVQYLDTLHYDFTDICFIDERQGWITGLLVTDSLGTGVILHTEDGGDTWEPQIEIVSDQLFGGLTLFTQIEMLDENIGWACGGSYSDGFSSTDIFKTENGGVDWENIGEILFPVERLKIASKDTLWASPSFSISFDGGINWKYRGPYDGTIWQISPIDGLRGWVFVRKNSYRGIYFTLDGGITWEEDLILPGSAYITEMTNLDGKQLWIVGTSGIIMYRENIPTSIRTNDLFLNEFYLGQNYPNPFNSSTLIEYFVPQNTLVKIYIYDISGRIVNRLVNKLHKRGNYTLKYDANNLSSGIYFYKIEANNFFKINKMLLIK